MMRAVLVVPITITACADRMLSLWYRVGYRGGGIMLWVFLILVIVIGCTPY
jgi:hypothetical protein